MLGSTALRGQEENRACDFPVPCYQTLSVPTQLQMKISEGNLCQTSTNLTFSLYGPEKASLFFFPLLQKQK